MPVVVKLESLAVVVCQVGAGNRLLSSEGAVALLTVEPSPQPPSLTFSFCYIFLLQALPYLRLFP